MIDFEAILKAAHAAASKAQEGMVEDMNALDCGFAWVTISGREPLARHCRTRVKAAGGESKARREYGSKGWPSGWQWWCPGGAPVQAIGIHEAGARAFRDKLAEFGIRADVGSRLD